MDINRHAFADAIRYVVRDCSMGQVLIARSRQGVCAIFLGDDPDVLASRLKDRFPHAMPVNGHADMDETAARVVRFIEHPGQGLDVPLDMRGTDFQRRVWDTLLRIPAGRTASYTDVAAQIGSPGAVRAVAGACASNLIAVAIPCHRVVRRDGALSGYRWGTHRKQELLAREAAAAMHAAAAVGTR